MTSKVFRSPAELQNHMQELCDEAVANASNRLLEELQKYIIEDYYNQYAPIYYIPRTEMFYKSAIAKMLGKSTASIGISDLYMDYQYPARYNNVDETTGHWTGEIQTQFASRGYHGTTAIQTEGRFWSDFEDYCEKNAIKILKEELRKVGFSIK